VIIWHSFGREGRGHSTGPLPVPATADGLCVGDGSELRSGNVLPATAVRSCVGVGSSEPERTVTAAAAAADVGVRVGVSSEPRWDRPLREFMVWKADQARKRLVSLPYLTEGTECLGLFLIRLFWDALFLTRCFNVEHVLGDLVFIKEVYEKGLRDSR
jgi:hypothetical protein